MGNSFNKTQQSLAFYWSLVATNTLTFLLNMMVFAMFVHFRGKLLVSTHNRILCSMALADTMVGLFGNNLGVLLLLKKSSIFYKLLGNIPMFSSLFVSILSLIMLTGDRLIAMKKPYVYGSPFYKRIILRLIIATWVVPCFIIIQQSLIFNYQSSRQELIVRSIFFIVFFTTGVLVLVISNVILFIGFRKYMKRFEKHKVKAGDISDDNISVDHSYTVNDHNNGSTSASIDKSKTTTVKFSGAAFNMNGNEKSVTKAVKKVRKRKVSKRKELRQTSLVCLLAVSLFIIFWLPLACYRLTYALGVKTSIPWLRRLALCLTIINSFCNPIIYLLIKEEFRVYMKKLIYTSLPTKICMKRDAH